MLLTRSVAMLTVAIGVIVATSFLIAGCGSEHPEFDKSVYYTPESLTQELVSRYRVLSPSGQASTAGPRKSAKASALPKIGADSKKSVKEAEKKGPPKTIDDVFEDIKFKVTLIKETTPSETTKIMINIIARDESLAVADKKALSEFVERLAN